jgi:hypothetical protein
MKMWIALGLWIAAATTGCGAGDGDGPISIEEVGRAAATERVNNLPDADDGGGTLDEGWPALGEAPWAEHDLVSEFDEGSGGGIEISKPECLAACDGGADAMTLATGFADSRSE